jgi:hypothetical protein
MKKGNLAMRRQQQYLFKLTEINRQVSHFDDFASFERFLQVLGVFLVEKSTLSVLSGLCFHTWISCSLRVAIKAESQRMWSGDKISDGTFSVLRVLWTDVFTSASGESRIVSLSAQKTWKHGGAISKKNPITSAGEG